MDFERIDLTRGGNIVHTCALWTRSTKPYLSILAIAFAGRYRDGSAGAPDAHFIRGVTHLAYQIWEPCALILDLRGLTYEWGDEADEIFEAPANIPFAIVVGPKCERALSTLRYGDRTEKSISEEENCFRSFEEAVVWTRRRLAQEWNEKMVKHPEFFQGTPPLNEENL